MLSVIAAASCDTCCTESCKEGFILSAQYIQEHFIVAPVTGSRNRSFTTQKDILHKNLQPRKLLGVSFHDQLMAADETSK